MNAARGPYAKQLRALQIELVKLQRALIKNEERLLILLEGRDSAGKDGTVKRFVEHLSPRETRVVALGKPSDRDRSSWYFQRYVAHLPAGAELVLFNRSWYNRAGVEPVMGFCTKGEHEEFLEEAPRFEEMLVRSGIRLFKYYLDIDREEQRKRLGARKKDPLKQWKLSPVDAVAQEKWGAYSRARNEMLARTHHAAAPWYVVRADDKKSARLNLMRNFLSRLDYPEKDDSVLRQDPGVVFPFERAQLDNGMIAP